MYVYVREFRHFFARKQSVIRNAERIRYQKVFGPIGIGMVNG